MKKRLLLASPLFLSLLLLTGCVSTEAPPEAFVVSESQLAQRQAETRRYDGLTEDKIVLASANVLQDLGYAIGETELKLGVLTGSKQRDASSGGEIATSIVVALLTGVATPVSKDQKINVLLVVRPVLNSEGKPLPESNYVRVSFQRAVTMTNGAVRMETLTDKELYQEFHDKLSKSVFIEAQKI